MNRYVVDFDRVGRHGSVPRAVFEAPALDDEDPSDSMLAVQILRHVRGKLGSSDVSVALAAAEVVHTYDGQIYAGLRNAGSFTVRDVTGMWPDTCPTCGRKPGDPHGVICSNGWHRIDIEESAMANPSLRPQVGQTVLFQTLMTVKRVFHDHGHQVVTGEAGVAKIVVTGVMNGMRFDPVDVVDWPPQPGDLWLDNRGRVWFFAINPVDQLLMAWTGAGDRLDGDPSLFLLAEHAPLRRLWREERLLDKPAQAVVDLPESTDAAAPLGHRARLAAQQQKTGLIGGGRD